MDIDGDLERRARGGDIEALLALGFRFRERGDVSRSRACFAQATKLNSTAGLRELAKSLLVDAPVRSADGVAMMKIAAAQGDGEAAHLCAILAAQDQTLPERWQVAAAASREAATRGHQLAQEEQNLLRTEGPLEKFAQGVPPKIVRSSPRIAVIENFVAPEVCNWLMARAQPLLARAKVYDTVADSGREAEERDNTEARFEITQFDLILSGLCARILTTVNLPKAKLEQLSILHYAKGERFQPHYDFLDASIPAQARDLARGGQRSATFLLYLNEDYDGGETEFVDIDFRYKGRKGDALLFWNVTPDGLPDRQTHHAGRPPTRGEKWLVSQWIREAKA